MWNRVHRVWSDSGTNCMNQLPSKAQPDYILRFFIFHFSFLICLFHSGDLQEVCGQMKMHRCAARVHHQVTGFDETSFSQYLYLIA